MPKREHFEEVAELLLAGRVTIVVAQDAEPLAGELARRFGLDAERPELARVSQAIATLNGSGPLYDTLHTLVEADGEPAPLHRFARRRCPRSCARAARAIRCSSPPATSVALERALEEAGEEFDSVCYIAAGPLRGSFCHISPDGVVTPIERPNAYVSELSLERRTIVLRLQGRVDSSPERPWESFAVTEDDFIHYGDIARMLPVALAARLRRTHLLLHRLHALGLDAARRARTALGRGAAGLQVVVGARRPARARAGVLAAP